jgi:NDP-sugar pyrophosphorylase family protein
LELDVFPSLLDKRVLIKVIEVEAPFIDIGTEESLVDAPLFINKNHNYF